MKRIKTIAVDMDGVLTDLNSSIYKLFNYSYNLNDVIRYDNYNYEDVFNLPDNVIWDIVESEGIYFWANLKPFKYARTFWNKLTLLKDEGYFDHLIILSSPHANVSCASGKIKWIQNWLGDNFLDYVLTKNKWLLANQHTVLIDDWKKNIDHFTNHGGKGILFPREWNIGKNDILNNSKIENYPYIHTLNSVNQILGIH